MFEFLDFLPSLETVRYAIVIAAKASSIDPNIALTTVACAATLVLAVLVQKIAQLVLLLSTGLKWLCYVIATLLEGLLVMIGLQRLWIVPEVKAMRCDAANFLAGIEGRGAWVDEIVWTVCWWLC